MCQDEGGVPGGHPGCPRSRDRIELPLKPQVLGIHDTDGNRTRAAKKWPRPYAWDLEKPAQNPEEPNSFGAAAEERVKKNKQGVGSQTHRGACVHPEDWSLGSDTNGVMEADLEWGSWTGRIWVLPEQRLWSSA